MWCPRMILETTAMKVKVLLLAHYPRVSLTLERIVSSLVQPCPYLLLLFTCLLNIESEEMDVTFSLRSGELQWEWQVSGRVPRSGTHGGVLTRNGHLLWAVRSHTGR